MPLTGALAPLSADACWILVRLIPQPDGSTLKLPVDLDGYEAIDAHDRSKWTTYDVARARVNALGSAHTVGYVLHAEARRWCLDLDACANANGTDWEQWALDIIAGLSNVAAEVSQSGTGLHVWGGNAACTTVIRSSCTPTNGSSRSGATPSTRAGRWP